MLKSAEMEVEKAVKVVGKKLRHLQGQLNSNKTLTYVPGKNVPAVTQECIRREIRQYRQLEQFLTTNRTGLVARMVRTYQTEVV